MKLKVLFFDIETAPLLAHIWHPAQGWVTNEQMLHDSFLLCWAAKWDDSDKVISARLSSAEAKAQDDGRIVALLADLIREADVIVAHNGDKFDLPRVNQRLLLLGLEPLGPKTTIDTLKLARKNFALAHNKLDYLASELGFGNKIKTDFSLWRSAYLGDVAALKEMQAYNVHDVVLLQQVFERMTPYVQHLTRLYEADYDGQMICLYCGNEGIENFQKRGKYRTQASTFQRVQCKNPTCLKYGRWRVSDKRSRAKIYPL